MAALNNGTASMRILYGGHSLPSEVVRSRSLGSQHVAGHLRLSRHLSADCRFHVTVTIVGLALRTNRQPQLSLQLAR